MRAPISFYGGKYFLVRTLLKLIPPHRTYVEPFGGAANLLFVKEPSEIEVYNDIDGNVVNFFRVLRDPIKCGRLVTLLTLTPYAREEFLFCRDNLNESGIDDVERARRFFVTIEQSFAAKGGEWGYRRSRNSARTFANKVDRLAACAERLRNVIIECDDFEQVIRRYDTPNTFFYCDPPYVNETLREPFPYKTMSLKDHERLVKVLLSVRGKVLLSGYRHQIYEPLEEAGWRCLTVGLPTFVPNPVQTCFKRVPRIECLWMNYQVYEEACSSHDGR